VEQVSRQSAGKLLQGVCHTKVNPALFAVLNALLYIPVTNLTVVKTSPPLFLLQNSSLSEDWEKGMCPLPELLSAVVLCASWML